MVNIDSNSYQDSNKKRIAEYLSERCKTDTALAEAVKKEKKSAEGVMEYIIKEAKAKAVNNVAMIEDQEVYNWACHYIMEDSIDCEPKKAEDKKAKAKKTEPKKKKKAEGKKKSASKQNEENKEVETKPEEEDDNSLQMAFSF